MDRLISEFEVIRAIKKYVNNIFTKNMGDLVKDIKAIPSAYKEMTNGEVLEAMFPNAEYKHIKTMSDIDGMEVNGINGLYDNFGQWCARDIFFYDDWWNSPYEPQESEDKE